MDLKKLREVLQIVAESDVAEVEIDQDGYKLTIRREAPTVTLQPAGPYPPPYGFYPPPMASPQPGSPPPPQTETTAPVHAEDAEVAPRSSSESLIKAPIVGTFYWAPSPEADPFVQVGTRVSQGTVLCIIEAMKLMNEIECEMSGTITEILVQNGEPVEYDQPLFVINEGA